MALRHPRTTSTVPYLAPAYYLAGAVSSAASRCTVRHTLLFFSTSNTLRAKGFGVGSRGSTRRRAIVIGILLVGTISVCLLAYVLQQPVLQVYWAVYARLYPLKDTAKPTGQQRT